MSQGFNHFDENGNAVMVDVSGKNITYRTAVATGEIHVGEAIMEAVKEGSVKKGDVLGVARVAGIMGVKRTSELIPMCHPLPIQKCSVDYELDETNGIIRAFCTVKTEGKTGVEMEALTGVQVTLLTIYDMCKAVDKGMCMTGIRLLRSFRWMWRRLRRCMLLKTPPLIRLSLLFLCRQPECCCNIKPDSVN